MKIQPKFLLQFVVLPRLATVILIFLLLIDIQAAFAQMGGATGSFARIGFGPRALSMSNAVLSVPEMGTFGFYNPAISAGTYKKEIEMGSSIMNFDRSLHTVALNFRLPPSAGISAMFMNAGVDHIDGRTLSGYPTENLSTNDYYFHAAFGVKAKENFWLGAGLKFILSDYHQEISSSLAFGLDVGFIWKTTEKFYLAGAIRDILLSHLWNSSDLYGGLEQANSGNNFPTTFSLGGSYRFLENRLIISSDLLITYYKSQITNRGISVDYLSPTEQAERTEAGSSVFGLQSGLSYLIHDRFRISAGYANRDINGFSNQHLFSSGFSLFLPLDRYSPSIEYAVNREPNVGTFIHTFSIKFNF